MPLFYQHNINAATRLGIWHITEHEDFFLQQMYLPVAIHHPHKRLQHLAARYLLRHLFDDFPYNEIVIADTRKPYLPNEQYHFSVSHCGDYAAAIVSSTCRVGIDIEIPTDKVRKIIPKFLHEEELKSFGVDALRQSNNLPVILWSAKEAVYKWWSYGGVDFKNNIRLYGFSLTGEGNIAARFVKDAFDYELQLAYKIFDDLGVVWLCTD